MLKLFTKFNRAQFSNIVTCDETWVYYFQIERKIRNKVEGPVPKGKSAASKCNSLKSSRNKIITTSCVTIYACSSLFHDNVQLLKTERTVSLVKPTNLSKSSTMRPQFFILPKRLKSSVPCRRYMYNPRNALD